MSILKYKYKAHKFINYAFYLVVFIAGFLLGFSTEKIDINKLVSQVLMIDNVSAIEIGTINGNKINEEYIFNTFNDFEDGFLAEYPYIVCTYHTTPKLECTAYSEEYFNSLYLKVTDSYKYGIGTTGYGNYKLRFSIDKTGVITGPSKSVNNGTGSSSTVDIQFWRNGTGYTVYSNFDPKTITGSNSTYSKAWKTLDFSDYAINLKYNENLFKDNPDFKEVCVNNYDTFSITSNEITSYGDDGSPQYHDFDFIWFQNGLAYLSVFQYDSEASTHINFPGYDENSLIGWGYWLDTKEEIDKHFSNDNPGMYLALKGYEDKYSYYNWTFYPFEMTFTTDYHFYTIFSFNNSYLKQAGISTVVDNAYIKYLDGTIKEDSDQYCFYIKNEYDVNILNRNENGDFNSTITVLGGINKDDKTYELEMGRNTKGFFSTVNNFISKIRPTVIFINTHIFELYTSLPLIVRSFIISFLVLILIRILIGMVVR